MTWIYRNEQHYIKVHLLWTDWVTVSSTAINLWQLWFFFKFLFTTAASQPVSIAQRHSHNSATGLFSAMWLQPLSESKDRLSLSNHLPARMKECHLQSDDMKWHTDFSALNQPCTFRLFPLHYRRLSAPSCLWTSPAWKWQLHSICVITGRSKGQNTTLKKMSRTGLLYKINFKSLPLPLLTTWKKKNRYIAGCFRKVSLPP